MRHALILDQLKKWRSNLDNASYEDLRQMVFELGVLNETRSFLISVLQHRFKNISDEIIKDIQENNDIEFLQQILDKAWSARTAKSFEKEFSLAETYYLFPFIPKTKKGQLVAAKLSGQRHPDSI
ncbi:MAG: hypothetical protein LBR22_01095 [Desulfovibrio sp.]|nr:hypothetical protein [Desulfovibrio sp.]